MWKAFTAKARRSGNVAALRGPANKAQEISLVGSGANEKAFSNGAEGFLLGRGARLR